MTTFPNKNVLIVSHQDAALGNYAEIQEQGHDNKHVQNNDVLL